MGEVLLYCHSLLLSISVPAAIVLADLAYLRGKPLDRAWPDASLWAAVVLFGPLCVPIHFIRTRRSLLGLALGLGWLACAVLLIVLPVEILGRIFGVAE